MHKDYLLELEELREFLAWFLRKDLLEELVALQELLNSSYIRRYKDLCEGSIHGTDCGYAMNAKELFLKLQEKPITAKIKYIYENFLKE
jgi:hypothetical protein